MEILVTHADVDPVPLPDWLRAQPIGQIIVKATDKEPRLRYQSAAEIIAALDAMKAKDPVLQSRPGALHVPMPGAVESTRPIGKAAAPPPFEGNDRTVKMASLEDEPAIMADPKEGWPLGYKILVVFLVLGLLAAIGVLIGVSVG